MPTTNDKPASSGNAVGVCPVCLSPAPPDVPGIECADCGTRHHLECWEYNKGCALYGCAQAPPTDKLGDLEIPPSYWGQTEKACPKCGKVIQAAATRCRHCGATFASAKPLQQAEFQSHVRRQTSVPMLAKVNTVLLIISLLPCTAPLGLLGGAIWCALKWKDFAALSPVRRAIPKIALGVAALQVALIVIIGIIYAAKN